MSGVEASPRDSAATSTPDIYRRAASNYGGGVVGEQFVFRSAFGDLVAGERSSATADMPTPSTSKAQPLLLPGGAW